MDRQLGQVINPFPAQLRALSADPYDDTLMEAFCSLHRDQPRKLEKVKDLYQSCRCLRGPWLRPQPLSLPFGGGGCVTELERYTMGYVDSYLHDGREMLREAKQRRQRLQQERRRLEIA